MPDITIPCEEEGIFIPSTECDSCAAYIEMLEDKMDVFTVGDGLNMSSDRVLSAERNSSNTYTKQEVDELIDTGGEFTAGDGITIANKKISADMNPTNTYTKAEVDAMIEGTGGALPVGTIIHSTSDTAPSLEGTWEKIFSLADGVTWEEETSTGFYYAESASDGPVMTIVVPGLHESGATVDDIALTLDFDSGTVPHHMIFIANGLRYNLQYGSGFTSDFTFKVRTIYGDTIAFDTHGVFPKTAKGATFGTYTNGMCRFRGLLFHCTKPLYYWKRVS